MTYTNLKQYTINELVTIAGNYGIEVPKGTKKPGLIELLQGIDKVVTLDNNDNPITDVYNYCVVTDDNPVINEVVVTDVENDEVNDDNQNDNDQNEYNQVANTITNLSNDCYDLITTMSIKIGKLQQLLNEGNFMVESELTKVYNDLSTLIPNYSANTTKTSDKNWRTKLQNKKGEKWVKLIDILTNESPITKADLMVKMNWSNPSTCQTYLSDLKSAGHNVITTYLPDGTKQYSIVNDVTSEVTE